MRKILGMLVVLAFAAAPAFAQKITIDYAHEFDFSKVKTFQLPLYKDKPPEPVRFDKPGVVVLGCNIHDWMVAYVYVVASPYFAKTDADGRAILAALPAGSYRIRAWHPRKKRRGSSQPREIRITSAPDSLQMAFTIGLKPEWRPHRPPE